MTTLREALERIAASSRTDDSRLIVHEQNPADNYYWTKAVAHFTVGEVRQALADNPVEDRRERNQHDG